MHDKLHCVLKLYPYLAELFTAGTKQVLILDITLQSERHLFTAKVRWTVFLITYVNDPPGTNLQLSHTCALLFN